MPRRARVVIPNEAHHVIQRGNYQQYVFEKEEDFRTYLYLMKKKNRGQTPISPIKGTEKLGFKK